MTCGLMGWSAKKLFALSFILFKKHATVKAPLSPRGGLINFGSSRGGLYREGAYWEGAYSQNQVTSIYLVAFQFSYPVFC